MDDWDQPALGPAAVRTVSARFAPDGERLREFAKRISASKRLALVYGQEIDRSGGWDVGVALAEKLNAPVFHAPNAERPSIPENHRLFQGTLPIAMGPLSSRLQGFDLAVVIGAPVFRYYPYIPGPVLPQGCQLLQVTNDPTDAAGALVGDSLLGDAKLTLEALLALVEDGSSRTPPKPRPPNSPLTASEVYAALSELRPENAIVVQESPSNMMDLATWWPTVRSASYYTFASGGLGWDAPAAVGVALAQKLSGEGRPVVAVIGDGSIQYSIQCLATAAQHKLKVIYIVPCNGEYAVLKEFAILENTPNVPGLDLPPLDIVSAAKGFGCAAIEAPQIEAQRILWGDAIDGSARDILAKFDGKGEGAERKAAAFLSETLKAGPRMAAEVIAEGGAIGLSEWALRRALKKLGGRLRSAFENSSRRRRHGNTNA